MTCREIADFLMKYIDGELPRRQRTTFEMHLAECPACRTYLKSYELTIGLARSTKCPVNDTNIEGIPDELVRLILRSCSPIS